ncbi:MAG: hypothetical protein B7Y36_08205 [Novosphingobium sp. 28-62-57]|nr:MAG: hypothetical protein B7Y36_08205 [Novosphingobium sp. 28-62-57]
MVAAMQPRLDQERTMPQRQATSQDGAPDPGFLDSLTASFRAARDDQPTHINEERMNAYGDIAGKLVARGRSFDRYWNTQTRGYGEAVMSANVWADVEAERSKDPKAFSELPKTRAEFDAQWQANMRKRMERDAGTVARSGWVPWLIGGLGGGLTDPINLGAMALTGGTSSLLKTMAVEAVVNTGTEALELPLINIERKLQGRPAMTAEEAAKSLVMAGALGAALPVGMRGAAIGGKAIVRGGKAAYDAGFNAVMPLDLRAARALDQAVPRHLRTPDVNAAINVGLADAEMRASSPYAPTYEGVDAHFAKLNETLAKMQNGVKIDVVPPVARPVAQDMGGAIDAYMAAARRQESSGDDGAKNRRSSATGRYQFIGSTWVEYYRKAFPNSGLDEERILARRNNGEAQERVMRAFTADNAAWLQRNGIEASPGNLYVVHHMGTGGAGKIFRAAPETPLVRILDDDVITANPHLRDMTAGEFRQWSAQKMGGEAGPVAAVPPVPVVRPEALDAVRPLVTAEGREIALSQFLPEEIEVDAALMQFKSGGDQFGVTERLQGVREWDPMAAGTVTVWESLDGRRLIADGHQRLGLAKRMRAANPDQPITMNAFVLREADGFSARDARVLTALKNIGEGTGSASDAAKVFRDTGIDFEEAVARRLPPKSALVRDGKALARLSDDAFGSIINEVIPEQYGAAIGHLAPDPTTHAGLVDLLHKLDPPNRRQAETIIKSALDAGFVRETQEELFGARDTAIAIFAMKARVLDKALGELRRLKGAFTVAARNADALDKAGNRIDVDASEAAAQGNALALALVEALALRKGNAVSDIINAAAERLARGEPAAAVNRDVIKQLTELDLTNVERLDADGAAAAADGAGGPAGAGGRGGIADGEAGAFREDADLTPATRDELEAAGQGGFALFDEPAHTAFDDPAGPGIATVADSAWHDVRAAVAESAEPPSGNLLDLGEAIDPAVRERERQKLQLRAETPLGAGIKGGQATGVAQNDVLPEGLFGGKEVPTFDLGDGKGPRTIKDIEDEIAADEAAVEAIRNCLL